MGLTPVALTFQQRGCVCRVPTPSPARLPPSAVRSQAPSAPESEDQGQGRGSGGRERQTALTSSRSRSLMGCEGVRGCPSQGRGAWWRLSNCLGGRFSHHSTYQAPTGCGPGAGRRQSHKVPTRSASSQLRPLDLNKFRGRPMSPSSWDRLPGEPGTELDLGRRGDVGAGRRAAAWAVLRSGGRTCAGKHRVSASLPASRGAPLCALLSHQENCPCPCLRHPLPAFTPAQVLHCL